MATPTKRAMAAAMRAASDEEGNGKGIESDGDAPTKRAMAAALRAVNIPTWISLSGDLAFSHQDGIYGFKFPKRFSELS